MDNEAYSSYPSEAEVLLTDGCDMFVLGVDHDVKITNNTSGQMAQLNGKLITVIHLFHFGLFNENKFTEYEQKQI